MRVGMLLGPRVTRLLNPIPKALFWELVQEFAYRQDPDPPIYLVFGDQNETGFYTGLWTQIRERLAEHGFKTDIFDQRPQPRITVDQAASRLEEAQERLLKRAGRELRPHQLRAVNAMIWEPIATAQIGTGGGKTLVQAFEAYILDRPTTVVVARDVLMTQLKREFEQIFDPADIGVFGGGRSEPSRVTIGIVNSLWNHPEILTSRELIIYDECHMSAAPNSRKMLLNCELAMRHGYTATYTRSLKDEINLLYSVSGPRAILVTASELIRLGVISKPLITMIKGKWQTKYGYGGDMQYEEMVRHFMVNNQERNRMGCEIIYQHHLLGHRCLVFVSRKQHGAILRDMLRQEFKLSRTAVVYVDGQSPTSTRERVLKGLASGTTPIVICTSIFDLGVDVPAVEMGFDMTVRLTPIGTMQSLGRIMRLNPNGAGCWWYGFYDESPPSLGHYARFRLSTMREEPGFPIRVCSFDEVYCAGTEFVPFSIAA